jgi:3-isopropylmalate dehydratase small subunit
LAKAWVYGDNVDTDVIIPARYLTTSEPDELAKHALEDLDPIFHSSVQPGDIVFAGVNFGCGSSREHAPLALRGAGTGAVVARSFARIFFRNAINTGLPILECPEAVEVTQPGDVVEVDVDNSIVRNVTRGEEFKAEPLPDFVLQIARAGGLVPWVRERMAAS